MSVGGLGAIKGEEGSTTINGFGGVTIKEVCGGVKGVSPINQRETGLKQKRAHDVIDGAKGALDASILLGSVWARHSEDYTMGEEEHAGREVVKLAAVVARNYLDRGVELRACVQKSEIGRQRCRI